MRRYRRSGQPVPNLRRKRIPPKRRQLEVPQYGWLPPIRNVQIQTHNRCNADCQFCPYIESAHAAEPKSIMTDEVWNLILLNLVPFRETINTGKVCPYLMQEPLLDKTIFSKIADIYRLFPETCVEVSTNGAALVPKVVENLLREMEGRNHAIWVSHHGVDKESLEWIMKINYENATRNLMHLLKVADGKFNIKIRGAGQAYNKEVLAFTQSQYIDYWTEELRKNNINFGEGRVTVDAFLFHDRAGTLHREDRGANQLNAGIVRKIDPKNPFYCCRVDQWVHFMYDGKIRLCCMDYHAEVDLPNITEVSLLDYYHSDAYYNLVETISGRKECTPGHICTRCISPGG